MTIKELQSKTHDWIKAIGVRYFSELTNMSILVEEVGELSRHMARQYGEQSYKSGMEPNQPKDKIAEELADIIFVVSCLANQMEIDLESAMLDSFKKKTIRDSSRHKDNKKLY